MAQTNRRKSQIKDEIFYLSTRPIPSCPGYRVDAYGVVYSCLQKGGKHPRPTYQMSPYWRTMVQRMNRTGYLIVGVEVAPGIRKSKRVSRLVLEAWVGPCQDGFEACHDDGIKTNNCLTNLRWDTASGNQKDRVRHGTSCWGVHRKMKLTPEQVLEIRRLKKDGVDRELIASQFRISAWHVDGIHRRRNWWYLKDDGTVIA